MTGIGTPTWKERVCTVVFHLSPQQKQAWLDALAMSDMRSMESAFLEFLQSQMGTRYLSDLETEYLRAKSEADAIYTKLGDRKMRYLVHVFDSFGGSPTAMDNYEEITSKMFKGADGIDAVIHFRHWLSLNRRMIQIEGHLRGTKPLKALVQKAKENATDATADGHVTTDAHEPSQSVSVEGDDEEDGEDPVGDPSDGQ